MRRPLRTGALTNSEVQINLSPLIDVVFLLLIFFVVTSTFIEEAGVPVDKPLAASIEDLEKHSIQLALDAQGSIFYAKQEIDLNSVRGIVSQQLQGQDIPVILLADKTSKSGRLVELIGECKLAGAKRISIAATKKQ